MATTTVECPECQARLKITDIEPGKKIRCPKCKTPFAVPEEEEEVETKPRRKAAARLEEDEEQEEGPRPTRPARLTARGKVDEKDEAPPRRKKARDADEDEGDEDRPKRKQPRDADEDEEEMDRPKRKQARDADEGEEEDRPRRKKSKKAKTKQGSPIMLWSLIGGGAALMIGGGIFLIMAMQGGKTPDSKKDSAADGKKGPETNQLPVWAPDQKILNQLGAEVNVQGYRIRPPKGYQLQELPGPGGAKAFVWASPRRVDGSAAQLIIAIGTPPADQLNRYTLEKILESGLESIKKRRKNWSQTETERGQVNGLTFVRARWTGTETASGKKMHGLHYSAIDGQTFIMISSQDMDPNHEAPLDLAEAAARTFKKN